MQELLGEFRDSDEIPASAVFTSDAKLTEAQISTISDAVADSTSIEGIADGVSPALA